MIDDVLNPQINPDALRHQSERDLDTALGRQSVDSYNEDWFSTSMSKARTEGPTPLAAYALKGFGEDMDSNEIEETFGFKPEEPMTYEQAEYASKLRNRKEELDFWMGKIDQSSFGSSMIPILGGFAGGMSDPLVLGSSILTGAAGGFIFGGMGGTATAIGLAGEIALEWGMEESLYHTQYEAVFGEEYTWEDSRNNLIASAALVGFMHGAGYVGRKMFNNINADAKAAMMKDYTAQDGAGKRYKSDNMEHTYYEDLWQGKKDYTPSLDIETFKGKTFYTSSEVTGVPHFNNQYTSMDINYGRDTITFTADGNMANAAGHHLGNKTAIAATLKDGANIIDFDMPIVDTKLLSELNKVIKDPTARKLIQEGSIRQALDHLALLGDTPIEKKIASSQIDDIVDVFRANGIDGAKYKGGTHPTQDFGGKYDHEGLHVFNRDAIDVTAEGRTQGPTAAGRSKKRVVTADNTVKHYDSKTTDRSHNEVVQKEVDTVGKEMEGVNHKPADGTDEALLAADTKQIADMEKGNADAEATIKALEEGEVNKELTESFRAEQERLADDVNVHSEGKQEQAKKAADETSVCVSTGGPSVDL